MCMYSIASYFSYMHIYCSILANLALVLQVLNVSGINYNELSLAKIHNRKKHRKTQIA